MLRSSEEQATQTGLIERAATQVLVILRFARPGETTAAEWVPLPPRAAFERAHVRIYDGLRYLTTQGPRDVEEMALHLARQVVDLMRGALAYIWWGGVLPFVGLGRCLLEALRPELPRVVHRRGEVIPGFTAPVREGTEGKVGRYLGDHHSVRDREGVVDEAACLNVRGRYGVQVLGIRRVDGTFVWTPHVATKLQRGDMVYWAEPHTDHRGAELFRDEVVLGDRVQQVRFECVEFRAYDDAGRSCGAPEHLCHCVIGSAGNRASEHQGALYFRNTFANLAVHLIIRRDGRRHLLPDPSVEFELGDRLCMAYHIQGQPDAEVNAIQPDAVERLLVREKFLEHISHVRASRSEGLRPLLPNVALLRRQPEG